VIDQTVEGPLRVGRISVDILGPIPLREAVVEVSVIKPGRRVHLTEARMIAPPLPAGHQRGKSVPSPASVVMIAVNWPTTAGCF
jgi:hypothetical protein